MSNQRAPAHTAPERRSGRACRCVLLLALLVPPAVAQDDSKFANPVDACASTASRARAPCQTSPERISVTRDLSIAIDLPAPESAQCTANFEFEYTQRDTIARAAGTITVADCAASTGEYLVEVRYRDANGQVQAREVEQTWQAQSQQLIEFQGDYPIGSDAELLRVRIGRIRCTCAAAAAAP